jgi:ABC-type uncharacterized transport system permease subunit
MILVSFALGALMTFAILFNVCMKCKNTQRFREVRAVKAIPYVLFLLLLVSVSVSVFGCRTCLTLSEVASPALL